jgi:hypothetical protein
MPQTAITFLAEQTAYLICSVVMIDLFTDQFDLAYGTLASLTLVYRSKLDHCDAIIPQLSGKHFGGIYRTLWGRRSNP